MDAGGADCASVPCGSAALMGTGCEGFLGASAVRWLRAGLSLLFDTAFVSALGFQYTSASDYAKAEVGVSKAAERTSYVPDSLDHEGHPPLDRRTFMRRVHIATALISTVLFSATPALSQDANQNGPPCPENSATVGSGNHAGNSAGNPASQQGVEHSAILPSAGGTDESAAPTVKKDGQEVNATECSKPPNQLNAPGKRN